MVESTRVMEKYDESHASPFTECILNAATDVDALFERIKEIV